MTLSIVTIYQNPLDFPGKFVARLFHFDKPTNEYCATETLELARTWAVETINKTGQTGFMIPRSEEDHERQVERLLK